MAGTKGKKTSSDHLIKQDENPQNSDIEAKNSSIPPKSKAASAKSTASAKPAAKKRKSDDKSTRNAAAQDKPEGGASHLSTGRKATARQGRVKSATQNATKNTEQSEPDKVTRRYKGAGPATKAETGTDDANQQAKKSATSRSRKSASKPAKTTAASSAKADPSPTDSGGTSYAEAAFGPQSKLPEQLSRNIERIEELTQRLIAALAQRRALNPAVEAPGPDLLANAATAWMKQLTEQPTRILARQVSYWGETLRHFAEVQAALAGGTMTAPPDDGPSDRRFSNPLWENHPFFNFVKRQYQINAQAIQAAADELDITDTTERRRIDWFTRQMIDMMAPTNFLATNPDALEKAFATEGESLVQGLENLVRDIEHHSGELVVSLADRDAFRVGENLATTPGAVVARTRLYELIQYAPATPRVHALPVVIFPPWINKFYVLDLKPENSLIKWIVDQGFTLFVVAWKNPDRSYAQTGLDDYVSAYLEVLDRVQDLTGQEQLNVVGYCIAGTTLALTLALLKHRGDRRVNSATFFTTLTDFSDQGEFTAFLQEDFLTGIETEIANSGMLPGPLMQRTFSFLRANDLVWGPAIRSYMLGESPPAFDLLFWNGDSTNLPGRMAVEYLRGLCQKNAFAQDGFTVLGQRVHLGDVTLPLCAIACETDHIAPWKDSWRGIASMGSSDRTFILSQSGHIAGIINPPSKLKYGHYTSEAGFDDGHEEWLAKGQFHEGSWWHRWGDWLAKRSGPQIEARDPGQGFGPAPGSFVHE